MSDKDIPKEELNKALKTVFSIPNIKEFPARSVADMVLIIFAEGLKNRGYSTLNDTYTLSKAVGFKMKEDKVKIDALEVFRKWLTTIILEEFIDHK